MHVVVMVNPAAGRGRASEAAERLQQALAATGHDVTIQQSQTRPGAEWLDEALRGADRLVVVGGDGAVRLAAESAARQGVPLCQFPYGTENLLSREFGMPRTPERLVHLLQEGTVRHVDLASANGEPFVLMASVGFDAEVVHDLAAHRNGSISHWSYVGPIVRQLRRWNPPHLEVVVDGRRIDDGAPGFVVVANSRQYGARLDPCCRADMTDGLLDVTWFPTRTRGELLGWMARCRVRRQLRDPRLVYVTGRNVEISFAMLQRVQLDGDPGTFGGIAEQTHLSINVAARVLPLLVPAGAGGDRASVSQPPASVGKGGAMPTAVAEGHQ